MWTMKADSSVQKHTLFLRRIISLEELVKA